MRKGRVQDGPELSVLLAYWTILDYGTTLQILVTQ